MIKMYKIVSLLTIAAYEIVAKVAIFPSQSALNFNDATVLSATVVEI